MIVSERSQRKERKMPEQRYTCADYREEMTLLGLQRRLNQPGLEEAEKNELKETIRRLKRRMGLD